MHAKKFGGGLVTLGLAAASLFVAVAPAQAAGCTATVSSPVYTLAGNALYQSSGGRTGCTSSANVDLQLKEDTAFSPDPQLALVRKTITNGSFNVAKRCENINRNIYGLNVTSSGQTARSGNVKELC